MSEQSIFLAALDVSDPAARAEYLREACGDDEQLRRRVEELLDAHARSGSFLDFSLGDGAAASDSANGASLTETSADDARAEREEAEETVLSFLAPPQRAGSLGRLGHYEIESVLGRGGCGVVLKAFDDKLHRVVAIKVIAPELAATSPARKRFLREARAAAAVRHDNVVSIHAVEEAPIAFLVMEFIEGRSLQQRLDDEGPFDAREVATLGAQIAAGLAAAHEKGLIHRDVKPANVLQDRGLPRIKITDFGLARTADDASVTQSGVIAGTPLYMSPEQAQGLRLDPRSDLFSLGSVLYALLSGRPPFRAPNTLAVLKRVAEDRPRPIEEIIPDAPPALVAVIAKLHAKNPAERYQSAREVVEALTAPPGLVEHARPGIPPAKSDRRAAPEARSSAARGGLLAAAAICAVAGAAFFGRGAGGPRDDRAALAGTAEAVAPRSAATTEATDDAVAASLGPEFETIADAVVPTISVSTAPGPAATPSDLERRRAEYFTSIGGRVGLAGRPGLFDAKSLPAGPLTITELHLAKGTVNPEAMQIFEGVRDLKLLRVVDSLFGDRALQPFRECRGLNVLDLHRTRVRPGVLAQFGSLDELRELSLWCSEVNDDDVARAEHAPLEILNLGGSLLRTDAGLARLENLAKLQMLVTSYTSISLEHAPNLRRCAELRWLQADNAPTNDAGLAHFADATTLTTVKLDSSKITDAGLAHLQKCLDLEVLLVANTAVTDAGIAPFKKCPRLKRLDVRGTRVTARAIEGFRYAVPSCRVFHDAGVVEPYDFAATAEIERKRAERVNALGGSGKVKCVDGKVASFAAGTPLPPIPFVVDVVNLGGKQFATDALSVFEGATRVTRLDLSNSPADNQTLSYFRQCAGLTHVSLIQSRVQPGMFDGFVPLERLVELLLWGVPFGDGDVPAIKDSPLGNWLIGGTRVSDAGLARLTDPTRLKWVNARYTSITLEKIPRLGECDKFVELSLDHTKVTDAGLARLPDLPDLKQLGLENTAVSDAGVARFLKCRKLREVILRKTKVSPELVAQFRAALPNCVLAHDGGTYQPLDLGDAAVEERRRALAAVSAGGVARIRWSDGSLRALESPGRFPDWAFVLKEVDLENRAAATDDTLAALAGAPDLEVVAASGASIGDAGLAALKSCPRLKRLDVRKTKVSRAALDELRVALPNCRVESDHDAG